MSKPSHAASKSVPLPEESKPILPEEIPTKPELNFPPGVQMVDAGVSPHATIATPDPKDPKLPPKGWKGAYKTCGGCGNFLPGNSCAVCSPGVAPSNIQMSVAPPAMR